jgi:stearoyl-CoA desaturase (delta-9 desaturase)
VTASPDLNTPHSRGILDVVRAWFDGEARADNVPADRLDKVDWLRIIPLLGMHAACLGVIWVGWSPIALTVAAVLYFVRMFAITGFYHRYFSHRSFRTSRWFQFILAGVGSASGQGGPLWWAAHHRRHHRASDRPEDVHSPHQRGFLWSHMLWFMSRRHHATRTDDVRDWAKYPELRLLNRYDKLVPLGLAVLLFATGEILRVAAPSLGTNGLQMFIWGFCISTVVLLHATLAINSLAHVWGWRRFNTRDHSRNNFVLALITLGEGWHNNHHYCPGTVRQGFAWWEIDITYYLLRAMSWIGLVWDLRPVPARAGGPARSLSRPDAPSERSRK